MIKKWKVGITKVDFYFYTVDAETAEEAADHVRENLCPDGWWMADSGPTEFKEVKPEPL